MQRFLDRHLFTSVSIAPLATFRVFFGVLMFLSTLRFMLKGWVYDLYVKPVYYFTFYGFDSIKPFNETGMYTVFGLMLLATLLITFGLFYRVAIVSFFLLFTYVELLDKTNYLNHYYFISLMSFILIWLPANRSFSLDVLWRKKPSFSEIPAWTINIIKFQLGVVYFFAGVAKINYEWLFEAQPLINWLKHQTELPILGPLMRYDATAYAFSWFGCIYDLSIPFILLSKRLNVYGYLAVIFFHVLTWAMFPIGVFPWVMIVSTTIFFPVGFHQNIISFFQKIFHINQSPNTKHQTPNTKHQLVKPIILTYIIIQLVLPFRYIFYPGKLFWTEQGFRFSWRVMLIEKAGYAEFYISDKDYKGHLLVDNKLFLTPQQEKMMSTQPDMILQYAHHLRDVYKNRIIIEGADTIVIDEPIVNVNSKVSLFNKGSQQFINPEVDLATTERGFKHKDWVLPYE